MSKLKTHLWVLPRGKRKEQSMGSWLSLVRILYTGGSVLGGVGTGAWLLAHSYSIADAALLGFAATFILACCAGSLDGILHGDTEMD